MRAIRPKSSCQNGRLTSGIASMSMDLKDTVKRLERGIRISFTIGSKSVSVVRLKNTFMTRLLRLLRAYLVKRLNKKVLARRRPDLGIGAPARPGGNVT